MLLLPRCKMATSSRPLKIPLHFLCSPDSPRRCSIHTVLSLRRRVDMKGKTLQSEICKQAYGPLLQQNRTEHANGTLFAETTFDSQAAGVSLKILGASLLHRASLGLLVMRGLWDRSLRRHTRSTGAAPGTCPSTLPATEPA